MTDKEALKQAQMVFNMIAIGDNLDWIKYQAAQQAESLRKALAQPTSGDYALGYAEGFNDACKKPEQEPVAWITPDGEGFRIRFSPPVNDVPLGWDALYTTPPQRKPLTEWQPIETAPKGPTILLYSPPLNEFSMRYRNITIAWWVSAQITEYWGTAVFFDGRSIVQHVHNPTHWMPLPDAPTPHSIKE